MEAMKTVSVRDARKNFSDLLHEVHFGRKKVIITKSGKPFVIITSAKEEFPKKEEKNSS